MQLKPWMGAATVAAIASASLVSAPAASADPAVAGTYNAVNPVRVLATRTGVGAPKAMVGPNKSITFSATSSLKTSNISAEALTIVATNSTAAGYLVAYPGGGAMPATSTLNYEAGSTTTNSAIVAYGASGTVTIYNKSTGPVNLVADLSGYWSGGTVSSSTSGAYTSLPGTRIQSGTSVAADGDLAVPVAGQGGIPATGVSAVAVNVTVPKPAAGGYLTGTANPTDQQGASSATSDIAFTAGQTHANLDVVPVDPDTGAISLHNGSLGAVSPIVDVVGYFSDGAAFEDGSFEASTPYRNSDTRTSGPVGAGKTVVLDLGVNVAESPALFKAVVANLTVTGATAAGYVVAWNGTGSVPATSNLNFAAKQTTSNSAVIAISSTGTVSVYNGSTGTVNVLLDVHGFVLNAVNAQNAAHTANRIRTALNTARRAAAARVAS